MSSAIIEAMKAIMMAFLSMASLSAVVIAAFSASVHVPIVKDGVLHLAITSAVAGF